MPSIGKIFLSIHCLGPQDKKLQSITICRKVQIASLLVNEFGVSLSGQNRRITRPLCIVQNPKNCQECKILEIVLCAYTWRLAAKLDTTDLDRSYMGS